MLGIFEAMTSRLRQHWHGAFIVLFVICLRLPYFHNPAINIDEQYYLVFADKWLNGGLVPYVDIWDRKPIGIFLLYGPAVEWFRDGVVGYQVTAFTFVVLTCAIVYRIGLLAGGRTLAFAAALVYATCPSLMDGAGGQTPVFYNLPVSAGALLILSILSRDSTEQLSVRVVFWRFISASFVFGVALQIKYICVVEVGTLSLIALTYLWQKRLLRPKNIAMLAAGMIVAGLSPTVAVAMAFVATGHWHAFLYANFISIFGKNIWRLSTSIYLWRLFAASMFCAAYLPLAAYALCDSWRVKRSLRPDRFWLIVGLTGWLVAAFVGGLLLGNPTSHYFLPTAAPLSVLTVIGLQRLAVPNVWPLERYQSSLPLVGMRAKLVATLIIPIIACFVIAFVREDSRGRPSQVYEIARYIKGRLNGGCLYIFDYFPVLYYLTQSCIPTIYAFPNHLNERSEMHSLEVDSLAELHRVLETQPRMIFVRRPFSAALDPAAIAALENKLTADYVLDAHFDAGWQTYDLYIPARTRTERTYSTVDRSIY